MRNTFSKVLAFALSLFVFFVSCAPEEYYSGISAVESNDCETADSLFTIVIEKSETYKESLKNQLLSLSYFHMGRCALNQGFFTDAVWYGNQARTAHLRYSYEGEESDLEILSLLTDAHTKLLAFDSASHYGEKLYEFTIKTYGDFSVESAMSIQYRGEWYMERRDYGRANSLMKRALSILQNIDGVSPSNLARGYRGVIVTSLESLNLLTANVYLDSVLQLSEQVSLEDHEFYAKYTYLKGQAAFLGGDYKGAVDFFLKSIPEREKSTGKKNHQAIASTLGYLGMSYRQLQNLSKAEEYTQKSIDMYEHFVAKGQLTCPYAALVSVYLEQAIVQIYSGKFESAQQGLDKTYNCLGFEPEGSINNKYFDDHLELVQYILPQIVLWQKKYEQSPTDFLQLKIQDLTLKLDTIHRRALTEMEWSKSKQTVEGWARNFRDIKIQNLLLFAEKTGNKNYEELAFEEMERSRGFLMRSGIRLAGAEFNEFQNEALIDSLHILSKRLYAEKRKKKNNFNPTEIEKLAGEYYKLQDSYFKKINALEKSNSRLFDLKYSDKVASVKEVQQFLGRDEAMLNYFIGDSTLTVFIIKKNAFEVFRKKDATRFDLITQNLRCGIINDGKQICQDFAPKFANIKTDYVSNAFELYQRLVEPLQPYLQGINSLIINSDPAFGQMPFEAILTELPDEDEYSKEYKYLLNDFDISYVYSATLHGLMLKDQQLQKATKMFLGVAPIFNYSSSEHCFTLENLKYNEQEVSNILDLFQGDLLLGAAATEQEFLRICSSYKIIHLSTHAIANDLEGSESLIAFSEVRDQTENECLYLREMYNKMKINAEMVVLSACETGLGEYQRGEGNISIARGFSYLGAKSIITSLWQVKEQSSIYLMEYFYKNLKAGMHKHKALSEAKKQYIKEHSSIGSSPYYWAGFIPMGDMRPMR